MDVGFIIILVILAFSTPFNIFLIGMNLVIGKLNYAD